MYQGARGLYAGAVPALVGNTAVWAVYFPCYEAAKRRASDAQGGAPLGPGGTMLAAAQAGALAATLTNPLWVVKTRLQLQRRERASAPGSARSPAAGPQYRGLYDGLRRVAAEEGVRGLYAGLGPSLLLVSHGMFQFAAYESLRAQATSQGALPLSAPSAALCGAASKLLASLLTYPVQVLRSRLQQKGGDAAMREVGGSVWTGLRALLANEGPWAAYRGFGAHLLRVLPDASLKFAFYEAMRRALRAEHS